jgi:hypothetical protein
MPARIPMPVNIDDIISVIAEEGPIKARRIAAILSMKYGESITRRVINSLIYSNLLDEVVQDEFFRWSLWRSPEVTPSHMSAGDTEDREENIVSIDSIVTLKYSNGEILKIGFKKPEGFLSTPFANQVKFISCKSPLAISIIGKKVGACCTPVNPKLSCVIFKIDQINEKQNAILLPYHLGNIHYN